MSAGVNLCTTGAGCGERDELYIRCVNIFSGALLTAFCCASAVQIGFGGIAMPREAPWTPSQEQIRYAMRVCAGHNARYIDSDVRYVMGPVHVSRDLVIPRYRPRLRVVCRSRDKTLTFYQWLSTVHDVPQS